MKRKKTAIHIGAEIRAQSKEQRIGPTELGLLVQTSKQNIYGIFQRNSLNTHQLEQFSKALNFDFFDLFSKSLQIGPTQKGTAELLKYRKNIKELRQQIKELKKEVGYLKEISTLNRRSNAG